MEQIAPRYMQALVAAYQLAPANEQDFEIAKLRKSLGLSDGEFKDLWDALWRCSYFDHHGRPATFSIGGQETEEHIAFEKHGKYYAYLTQQARELVRTHLHEQEIEAKRIAENQAKQSWAKWVDRCWGFFSGIGTAVIVMWLGGYIKEPSHQPPKADTGVVVTPATATAVTPLATATPPAPATQPTHP